MKYAFFLIIAAFACIAVAYSFGIVSSHGSGMVGRAVINLNDHPVPGNTAIKY